MAQDSANVRQLQAQEQKGQTNPWADNSPLPRMVLTFSKGLNENISPTPNECTQGYNFDLAFSRASFVPRAPFDLVATTPNAGAGTSLMQLVKRDNTQTTLVTTGNTVYTWDGASTFVNKATVTAPAYFRDTYWSLGDYLVITDVQLNNVVMKWDGTTFGPLTTGLGSSLYAKYGVVQNNRVWLFNIKIGSTSYPHMILACAFENPTSWDTSTRGGPTAVGGGSFSTGLEAFYLLVPDLKPINGAIQFQNTLIISTLGGRIWQLTGSSSSTYQFQDFYDTSAAIGTEAVASIGNDVVFVRPGGSIALLSATQAFGNAFQSNLSAWLPTTTNGLSTINGIVYDQYNQRILFFIPNKVLVLYKDLLAQDRYKVEGGESPWSVYTTQDASGFNSNAVKYMLQPGTSTYTVYFVDANGRIMNLYGSSSGGDAGTSIVQAMRRSRHIGPELVQPWPWTEENITGHVRYRRVTSLSASITLDWDDEYNSCTSSFNLKGPTGANAGVYFGGGFYFGGTSYFNQGFNASSTISSVNIEPGGKGPGFYVTLNLPNALPTQVDSVEFD